MTAGPERHLPLLRSLVTADRRALEQALADPGTDVAGFLRFAHRHQLGAYAYWALQQLGLTGLLSPRILAATKASSFVERTRSERLARQLRDLDALFAQAGVRVLSIKGPLFAQRFYGSLDARGFADLDVLVRTPADVDRIDALLLGAGFERAFRILGSRRLTRYFAHHFEYRREGLPLDVHWALQRHFTFAIDYPRIWATAARVELAGRSYETTSDEYELVLQILGVLIDLQVGKLALRTLVDVYRILTTVEGRLDWAEFSRWRARERILRPAVFVLALVLDVLDCRGEFPALRRMLDAHRHAVPSTAPACRAVLESRPLDLGHKLLALRIYETPLAASLSWWLVSLPFRVAVYGVRPLRRGP
jgi:hypothetical protein